MTKAYKRIDLHGAYHPMYFKSKEEMREYLIELHSYSCSPSLTKYLTNMSFEDILEYGDWDYEEVDGKWNGEDFIENKNN